MPQWIALGHSKHANAGWTAPADYRFTQKDGVTPVHFDEISRLVGHFPLAFLAQGEGDQQTYQLVALQALKPQNNVYVTEEGQWLAPVLPDQYRFYPFALLELQKDQLTLCIDQDSGLFDQPATDDSQPLFAGEQLSEAAQAKLDALRLHRDRLVYTQQRVNELQQAGLIQPWSLQINISDQQQTTPVEGLFAINESALRALSGDQLQPLAASGALALAYSQLLSQKSLEQLQKRYQYRHWLLQQPLSDGPLDLTRLATPVDSAPSVTATVTHH